MKKLLIIICLAFIALAGKAQNADSLFFAKDYVKASDAYYIKVKNETADLQTYRRLAFCYLNIDNTEMLADIYFKKALALDPKDMASNYYLGVMAKNALSRDLTPAQRANAIKEAKAYFKTAANAGSKDAVKELASLN